MTEPGRVREFRVEAEELDSGKWSPERIVEMERKSIDSWASLDDPSRRAMIVIVRDCLIRLLEDPSEWLPTSLLPVTETEFGIFVFIRLDSVDEEVMVMRQLAERELIDRIAGVARIANELDTEGHR